MSQSVLTRLPRFSSSRVCSVFLLHQHYYGIRVLFMRSFVASTQNTLFVSKYKFCSSPITHQASLGKPQVGSKLFPHSLVSSSFSGGERVQKEETQLEGPAPLLSYRHRLESYHFTSLTDLVNAPYAPSIFAVIQDVVRHIRQLEADSSVGLPQQQEPEEDQMKASGFCGSSLVLCRNALSSPREVHKLVQHGVRHAAEIARIASEMGGDPMSHHSLREVTSEVSAFMDFVKRVDSQDTNKKSRSSTEDRTALTAAHPPASVSPPWALQDSVRVVLYRAVLEIAAVLGLHVLAVDALQALTDLEEQWAVQHAKEKQQHRPHSAVLPHNEGQVRQDEKKIPHTPNRENASSASLVCADTRKEEDGFSLDDVVEVVEQDARLAEQQNSLLFMGSRSSTYPEIQNWNEESDDDVRRAGFITSSADYVKAVQSCAAGREFDLGLALYHRLLDQIQKEKKRVRLMAPPTTARECTRRNDNIGGSVIHRATRKSSSDDTWNLSLFNDERADSIEVAATNSVASTVNSFVTMVEEALIALANACRHHEDFHELRRLLVESEVAAAVPVSVPLYTAMITAVSRSAFSAAHVARQSRSGTSSSSMEMLSGGVSTSSSEKALKIAEVNAIYQQHLSVAFSFYRQLRDVGLMPTAETYASLIGCCAICQEPTQAFALYHEARVVCATQPGSDGGAVDGTVLFPPSLYTNLLLAYHYAGYAADAKKTLEVLVEAGAPLERASFHAALASCVSLREGQEILDMMVQQYHIPATPHTYAFLLQAVVRRSPIGSKHNSSSFGGVDAVLHLYDLHEAAMQALSEQVGSEEAVRKSKRASSKNGADSAEENHEQEKRVVQPPKDLDAVLVERYAPYVTSLTQALLHLRIDPEMDPRLPRYLKPLIRVAQLGMNRYTDCSPQCPTHVPPPPSERVPRSSSSAPAPPLCVAVLSADVLANLEEFVLPFLSHYSLLVIPFCALVALQQGGAYRVNDCHSVGGESAPVAGDDGSQTANTVENSVHDVRRRKLQRFLKTYAPIIHLMSCEEELRWSRDVHRYGIPRRDWLASAAAITLNLARTDVEGGTKLYAASAEKPFTNSPILVLVSSKYRRCGKFLLDFKRGVQDLTRKHHQQQQRRVQAPSAALQAAVAHVFYHNPYTTPHWTPPTISGASAVMDTQEESEEEDNSGPRPTHPTKLSTKRGKQADLLSPEVRESTIQELKRRIIRGAVANDDQKSPRGVQRTRKLAAELTNNSSALNFHATGSSDPSGGSSHSKSDQRVAIPTASHMFSKHRPVFRTSGGAAPGRGDSKKTPNSLSSELEEYDFSAALLQSIMTDDDIE